MQIPGRCMTPVLTGPNRQSVNEIHYSRWKRSLVLVW